MAVLATLATFAGAAVLLVCFLLWPLWTAVAVVACLYLTVAVMLIAIIYDGWKHYFERERKGL